MDLRILIAEDEPHLSAVLCDYFLSRGDRPTPALNGTVALELAQAEEFDGVLLDIMMPGLNGLSVCRAIRKESDIPIIFLTALSDEEDKLLGYELGADDYISEDMILTADEGRMEQVISNLMSNAVKYTPESGSIYLRLHQKNGNAHFYIENTAAPLSEEALTKVWESFYRADPSRSEPGTGLGLAVVKNIIQLHRGECTVRNTTLDGGATAVEFGFIVPLS